MGFAAVTGAQLQCPFGNAPCNLVVTSQQKVMADGKPVATIQDCAPNSNIPPFGMCMSLANPTVAAATAAALGVLTPQPCTPVPAGTWIPGNPKVMADSKVILTNEASLMCGMGMGKISIINPGQTKVIV